MQADTLYHRMLDQEKAIEKAKEEGLPPPAFPPLLSAPKKRVDTDNPTGKQDAVEISDLRERIQAPLKKKLATLEGEERELTENAMKAEIAAGAQVAKRLDVINSKQEEERRIRKEQGRETIADRIASSFRSK